MKMLVFLKKLITSVLEFIRDLVVREEEIIQKLLDLDPNTMKSLLPASPVNMENIFVLFDYRNKVVKTMVKSIKYKNNQKLKKRIASYFYELILDLSEDITLFEGSPPIIVPMPMSKNEKKKKGFNQCEEIVREIEKIGNPDVQISYNTLKKIRETKRQTTLDKEKRLLNVRNSMSAFLPNKASIKIQDPEQKRGNRTVIVIDDVYTTLATFYEAEHALKQSGAKRVIGLFIAH